MGSLAILALVGPKGCGKTFVGRTIEKNVPNATFLSVEKVAMDFLKETGGSAESMNNPAFRVSFYERIRKEVDDLAATLPSESILLFETTGAAPEAKAFLEDLKHIGTVYLVRIRASTSICAERINSRDSSKQVDVPLEMIERLHAATEALDWEWDLELANETSLSEKTILDSIFRLLQKKGHYHKELTPLSAPIKVYQDDFSPARGNALQAAVASIFGLSLQNVPNFIESPDGYEAAIKQFYQQGAKRGECVKIKLNDSRVPEQYNDKFCILRGKSPRGDFGHVVVAKHLSNGDFEMMHDPHPDGDFLDASEAYGWCLFFA